MANTTNYGGQIASKLQQYRSLGQQEAGHHRPASTAPYPDEYETQLRSEAEGFLSNEQSLFDEVVNNSVRSSNDASGKLVDIQTEIKQALSDNTLATQVEAELSGERRNLVDLTVARIQAEVEWRSFRAKHGITDLPNYPDSPIFHWAIVAALAVIETLMNAFFYQNSNGLVGGFVVAASVAAINMGASVVLGNVFRRRNLKEIDQQVLGWSALVAFILITFFCNALFASFRSVYQLIEDPSDAAAVTQGFREAWNDATLFFVGNIKFDDLSSFVLFGIGILLSVFAFWKGFTSDDPYPGHSRRDKALKAAQKAERVKQDEIKQHVKSFLNRHRTYVQGLSTQIATLISALSSKVAATETAKLYLSSNSEAIQRDYAMVLDGYRQANLAIRGIEPPSYFSTIPDLTSKVSDHSAVAAIEIINSTIEKFKETQDTYRDDINLKMNELQSQMSGVMTGVIDDYFKGVDVEAKEVVQSGNQVIVQVG